MNELELRYVETQFIQIILHHLHRRMAVLQWLHIAVLVEHESLCFLEIPTIKELKGDNASVFVIFSKVSVIGAGWQKRISCSRYAFQLRTTHAYGSFGKMYRGCVETTARPFFQVPMGAN